METESQTPLSNNSENLSDDQPSTTAATISLGFRLGNLGFLIASDIFSEIIQRPQINPLPLVQPWFLGLLNLRGTIVPVLDILQYLEEPASNHAKRQLLVIDKGEQAAALWIDGYPEIISSVSTQVVAIPHLPPRLQAHVTGAVVHSQQIWLTIRLTDFLKALGAKPI
jgi:chemotaxis signal transduction protein